MAHQFQDLEDKENERRKAMGLPPVSWDDLYRQEREFLRSQPKRRKSTRTVAKESTASVEDSSPLLNSALQGIEKKLKEDERRKSQDRVRRNKELEKTEALGASLDSLSRSTAESMDLLEELLRLVRSGNFGGSSGRQRVTAQDASALGLILGTGGAVAGLAIQDIVSRLSGAERTTDTSSTTAAAPGSADIGAMGLRPETPQGQPAQPVPQGQPVSQGLQGQPAQPVPQGQPAQPVPQAQPAQPVPQGQPVSQGLQAQPAQPVPQGQPAQPVPQAQPAQPVPQGQPVSQGLQAQPAQPVPQGQPVSQGQPVPQAQQISRSATDYISPASQRMSTDSESEKSDATAGSTYVAKDPVLPNTSAQRGGAPKSPLLTQQQKEPMSAISTPRGTEGSALSGQEINPAMRELALKARKITFSGDEIRLGKIRQDSLTSPVSMPGMVKDRPSADGSSKIMETMSGPAGPKATSPASGGTVASEGGVSADIATMTPQSPGSPTESIPDLKFAPGVDPRIKEDIATKVKKIESDISKPLLITSGFRDPQRNAAAGGARNSAHTRANAVDVRFPGSVEDTIKFIEQSTAAGIGGIGVYGPGRVHVDTEAKRVWGPDYTARSIPEWAKPAMDAHMGAEQSKSTGPTSGMDTAEPVAAEPATPALSDAGAAASGSSDSSMESGASAESAPAPEMVASDTGMGQAVTSASQENAIEERIPAPVTEAISDVGVSSPNPTTGTPTYIHSADDPGNVEPEDAAERYARLFNLAA